MRRRRFNSVFTPSRDFTCCYYMSCSAQGVELLRYIIVASIMYYHDDEQIQPVSVSKHSGSGSENIQTLAAASALVIVLMDGNIFRLLSAIVSAAPSVFLPLGNDQITQIPRDRCPRCWYAQYCYSVRRSGHIRDKNRLLQ